MCGRFCGFVRVVLVVVSVEYVLNIVLGSVKNFDRYRGIDVNVGVMF